MKSKERKTYLESCYYLFLHWRSFFPATAFPIVEKVDLKPVFYFQVYRARDGDNLVAWLKPAIDALVLARIITGDDLEKLNVLPAVVVVGKMKETSVLLQLLSR